MKSFKEESRYYGRLLLSIALNTLVCALIFFAVSLGIKFTTYLNGCLFNRQDLTINTIDSVGGYISGITTIIIYILLFIRTLVEEASNLGTHIIQTWTDFKTTLPGKAGAIATEVTNRISDYNPEEK